MRSNSKVRHGGEKSFRSKRFAAAAACRKVRMHALLFLCRHCGVSRRKGVPLLAALMAAMMAALSREKKEQAGDREQFLHLPHCSHHTVWPSDTANGASTTEGGGGGRRRPCKYISVPVEHVQHTAPVSHS